MFGKASLSTRSQVLKFSKSLKLIEKLNIYKIKDMKLYSKADLTFLFFKHQTSNFR